ncbi:hypothetical protein DFS34DRAFT_690984 [Phlyctochytrium arcticum]|nr:hypothetical protein DFS34DRAFT_690984 [Phlyctochytrium arcticum]
MAPGSTGNGPVMSANAGNIPIVTPLAFTSAGRSTTNVLLVKDHVGKTRPSVYSLPGLNHVYGKKVPRDPNECAATVLQHWHVRALSKDSTPALDYVAMNLNSAKHGLIDPKDIREYRKRHPVRIHVAHDDQNAQGTRSSDGGSVLYRKSALPSDRDNWFTYGKPTRPSTPVASLMTDKYQREWLEEQEKLENERAQASMKVKVKKRHHKAVQPRPQPGLLSNPIAERDPWTLWKMSKFDKVGPHLNTWRESEDPAMNFESQHQNPFRVVNDKWLGVQPREMTRPIYMQPVAAAAEKLTKGRRTPQKAKARQDEGKVRGGKEVRFVVEEWKDSAGNVRTRSQLPKPGEIPDDTHHEARITTTQAHISPAYIDSKTIQTTKAANGKITQATEIASHACPIAGTSTVRTTEIKEGKAPRTTVTETSTDPVTKMQFVDSYAMGAAPLSTGKPAPVTSTAARMDKVKALPGLPAKTGDFTAVAGAITV